MSEPAETLIRQKVTSYHEAKKRNLIDKMGTSIKNRHKFFRTQDQEFTNSVTAVLKSDLTDLQRYEKLIEVLKTMEWNPEIKKLPDTDLSEFELSIEYDKFTCFLVGNENELKRDVIHYFNEMMLVNADPYDVSDGVLDEVNLKLL